MLDTQQQAPDFELENQDGEPVRLSDYAGQTVVLYFYPRAGTGGCTMEATGFRDRWDDLVDRNIAVLAVSNDSVADLAEFKADNDLPFDLLSDPDGEVATQYETYGTKESRGEVREIAFRNTYIIDADGIIEQVYEDVSPEGHADEVLADR